MFLEVMLTLAIDNFNDNGIKLNKQELRCLAENVFFEARGEGVEEQMFVASVTLNRVKDKRWPNTICGVVYQPHQFSWTKDKRFFGKADTFLQNSVLDRKAMANIIEQSGLAMSGLLNDYTGGADHYHRKDVKPVWRKSLELAFVADTHIYYK